MFNNNGSSFSTFPQNQAIHWLVAATNHKHIQNISNKASFVTTQISPFQVPRPHRKEVVSLL